MHILHRKQCPTVQYPPSTNEIVIFSVLSFYEKAFSIVLRFSRHNRSFEIKEKHFLGNFHPIPSHSIPPHPIPSLIPSHLSSYLVLSLVLSIKIPYLSLYVCVCLCDHIPHIHSLQSMLLAVTVTVIVTATATRNTY